MDIYEKFKEKDKGIAKMSKVFKFALDLDAIKSKEKSSLGKLDDDAEDNYMQEILGAPTIKYFQATEEEVELERPKAPYRPSSEAHEVGIIKRYKNFKLPKIKLPKIKSPKLPKFKLNVSSIKFTPKVNLPKVRLPKLYAPARTHSHIVKNNAKRALKTVKSNIIHCYDLTMDLASLYSFRHESVLGIDITPNCIYLCKIDGLNGKRVLTSMTSVVMEGKFMTEDIVNNKHEYADSLKELIKENDLKTKNVALSIPVSHSIVKTITIPAMDDAEIKKALRFGSLWNNFMRLDQRLEDYSVFYQVMRRNKSSESMDVLFVATKLSDISLYTDIVKNSGLNPVIVDVRCFAISNAFNHKVSSKEDTGPSVFLEIGFEDNYAMIVDGDGARIFEITVTDAHRAAIIDDAMNEAVIDEFISDYSKQVKKIINGYEKLSQSEAVTNIYVMSSVQQIDNVIYKMSDVLEDYVISQCNFFDCMDINDNFTINAKSAKQNLSAWAGAIGGALRKIDVFGKSGKLLKYNTNFLPSAGRYAKEKRIKYFSNAASLAASIFIINFIISTYGMLDIKNKRLSDKLAHMQTIEGVFNIADNRYNKLDIAAKGIEELGALITNINIEQSKLLYAHQYLNMVILDDVWLKELNYTAPDKLEITGGATNDHSIIEFIALLNEGRQFDKVALRGMEEIREVTISRPEAVMIKSFQIDSGLAAEPVIDINNINMMAGKMNKGG